MNLKISVLLCRIILSSYIILIFPTYVSAPASQSTQSEELSATNAAAQLSDADLALVMAEVYAARDKWLGIGMALMIPYDKIECIQDENVDAGKGLQKMLLVWLRTGSKKTWRFLAEALGHDLVKEVHLRNSIIARLSPIGILTATKESDISKFEVVYLLELVFQ